MSLVTKVFPIFFSFLVNLIDTFMSTKLREPTLLSIFVSNRLHLYSELRRLLGILFDRWDNSNEEQQWTELMKEIYILAICNYVGRCYLQPADNELALFPELFSWIITLQNSLLILCLGFPHCVIFALFIFLFISKEKKISIASNCFILS